MSSSRIVLAVVLLLAASTMACTPASSGDASVEELEKKITALTQRVAELEKRVAAGGSQAGNPALEKEATEAFAKINTMVGAGQIAEAKTKLTEFNRKYGTTKAGKQAQSLTAELAVVGKDSPKDWGIEKWFQGEKDVDLGSGTTLLVFWEEWCPHCRREVPKVQQMYNDLKGKGLQVVGLTKISRSSTEDKVTSFLSDNNVSYPVAKENGQTSSHFGVRGIPAAAVVKDGKVVWRGHPIRLTEQMINNWL